MILILASSLRLWLLQDNLWSAERWTHAGWSFMVEHNDTKRWLNVKCTFDIWFKIGYLYWKLIGFIYRILSVHVVNVVFHSFNIMFWSSSTSQNSNCCSVLIYSNHLIGWWLIIVLRFPWLWPIVHQLRCLLFDVLVDLFDCYTDLFISSIRLSSYMCIHYCLCPRWLFQPYCTHYQSEMQATFLPNTE